MQVNDYLEHYQVKGAHWGVKNGPPYPLDSSLSTGKSLTKKAKKKPGGIFSKVSKKIKERRAASKAKAEEKVNKRTAYKRLSDDELRKKKDRLRLENEYLDELAKNRDKNISKGRKMVARIIEKSGENIITQLVTYTLGTGVNAVAGQDIVNPKKGQKDK